MSISKINGETIIAAFGGGYSLRGTLSNTAFNPSGGTTYYGGGAASLAATTSVDTRKLYIPKSGTIKSCYGYFNQTAAATGATGSLNIRLNNTTDYLVGTTAHNSNHSVYGSTSLNNGSGISVTQGNYIEFKWTCPTGVTGPSAMTSSFIVYVE